MPMTLKQRFRGFYLLNSAENKGVAGAGVFRSSWGSNFDLVVIGP